MLGRVLGDATEMRLGDVVAVQEGHLAVRLDPDLGRASAGYEQNHRAAGMAKTAALRVARPSDSTFSSAYSDAAAMWCPRRRDRKQANGVEQRTLCLAYLAR